MTIQLTNPIVSFEIIFVLSMILWAGIGFLDPDYGRDPLTYLEEAFGQSNILLVLLLFVIAITGVMLAHLYYLLAPYKVQIEHEKWLDQMILKLECMSIYSLYIPSIELLMSFVVHCTFDI